MTGIKRPEAAMILAAGLGTRMRPLTNDRPKVLVSLNGLALIDHTLERLYEVGVGRIVVNVHHHAEMLASHLAQQNKTEIRVSDESTELLETGGGIAQALPLLDRECFYVVNGDVVWLDGVVNTLDRLANRWDAAEMDALLLVELCPRAVGYAGVGDFMMDGCGLLRRRQEREVAPYVYAGVQILHRRLFESCPTGAFSLNLLYDRAIEAGRLFGLCHDGLWLHVGSPDGLRAAEVALHEL